ncbi:transmembrane 9 superfamily member 2-like isoform X1 [Telopea speciosissima]|uniref:transmembrane 9 superfamily member 2-like isoform X1 n=1 Tax=Telopea speciosissima TaxID=54955 RepID=UPI001CC6B6A9|nr:transmembrane 9 superfamily member 2-like isoform X1 [Telopea speciosissima]
MFSLSRFHLFLIFTFLVISYQPARSTPENHRYSVGDVVPLFVNKVGPLNNPSETYHYYDLPFCLPDQIIEKKESLGEILNGDRLTNALYELKFRKNKIVETLCEKQLTRDEVAKFRDATKNDFYFQMYYDDLPLWGFVGKVEETWFLDEMKSRYYLFKHVQFDALYNEDQIIDVHAFSDPTDAVDITEDHETIVTFTYSVLWNASSTRFENRMSKYSRSSRLPQHLKIHWFSIINSLVIVLILVGMLAALFLRNLKSDLTKYSHGDEEEDKEEVGWKHISGDVFRYPPYTSLLCAILGSGTQLLSLVFFVFALALMGVLYPYNRGALLSSLVMTYALTSVIAGYVASSFHSQFLGRGWEKSVLLAGVLYFGPVFVTFSILNTVSIYYRTTTALPFGTIVLLLLVWTLVSIPLLALGGIFRYRFRSEFQAPCATKKWPTEIQPLAWYRKTPAQMFLGGFVPFSAIFIELHYIYTSIWSHKIYIVYGILLVVFIILILVTTILSIGLTYLQLTAEDHEWWWRSLLRAASTAIFMYVYCIYYYTQSSMNSFLQLSFFFGYNALMCYGFFLMLGTIGFIASLLFIQYIYRNIKSE